MLFDGTGDYLQWTHAEDAERTNLNNRESWTISLWIRAANINKTQYLVDRWKSSPRAGWFLYVTSGNIVTFFHNNTALSATTNIAADTWYHVAVTFDGTTCRLFLDGTQEASTGSLSDIDDNGNVINPAIAYYNHGGGSGWDGWIDDIWIRRGKAVWTSNFTSPTEARGDSTGHPEFITTIGIKNLELDSEDNNGYTVRNIIPISIVGEYDEIRATCKAALANALEVDNMSVGIHTSGGSTSATPTEILENATSGMSVAAGAKKTTDWTTFSFTDTDDLILIFDISSVASYFKLAISGSDSVYTKAATKSYDQSSVPSLILVPGQRYIADRVEAKTLAAA